MDKSQGDGIIAVTMGIAFLILGLLALLGGIVYASYTCNRFVKNEKELALSKKVLLPVGIGLLGCGLGGAFLTLAASLGLGWKTDGGHLAMGIIGNFFFAIFFIALWLAFYLRFYKKDYAEKCFQRTRYVLFGCIPLSLAFFLLAGEGLAPYLTYPLANGIAINGSGFHLYTYLNEGSSPNYGGLHLAFYGIAILIGAVIAWKMSDHHMYQKYGKHGILDGCFLWAFPGGIVGARIWYVVGNWNGDAAGGPNYSQYVAEGQWYKIFAIWEGGLTILGGAVGGILVGMIYMLIRRKYVDLRIAMDMVLPTILVAQAIGRWGNFFNHEVYGNLTNMDGWPLLPTWLKYQMGTGFTDGSPNFEMVSKTVGETVYTGNMFVPLFLIEGIFNLMGYFVIWFAVRNLWKKTRAFGSLSMCYLVWYGVTRMIMEPLRDPTYNMGSNGWWSFWNSMVYVLLGVGGIVFFQLLAYFRKKAGKPLEIQLGVAPKEAPKPKKNEKVQKSDITSAPKARKKEEEQE